MIRKDALKTIKFRCAGKKSGPVSTEISDTTLEKYINYHKINEAAENPH